MSNEFTNFEPFETAYDILSQKLIPQVYDLGFLPE